MIKGQYYRIISDFAGKDEIAVGFGRFYLFKQIVKFCGNHFTFFIADLSFNAKYCPVRLSLSGYPVISKHPFHLFQADPGTFIVFTPRL